MSSVNMAVIVGRLGKAPESRFMPNGDPVCNFSVATSEQFKDKTTGEKREIVEWHRCVAFSKLAEIIQQYVTKGSLIYVEGRLQTRKWEKDGQTHYSTEIKVDTMKMLGSRPEGASNPAQSSAPRPAHATAGGGSPGRSLAEGGSGFSDFESDIPFINIGRGIAGHCYWG